MKAAAITVRIDAGLKGRIEARAKRERRSLSAQIEHELEAALQAEPRPSRRARGHLLGRLPGPVPSDRDFAEVRTLMTRRLGARRV